MRITLDLEDELGRQAEEKASSRGVSVQGLIEELIRHDLGCQDERRPYYLRWRTDRGRLLPGVDLDSRNCLSDRSGERE